MHNFSGKGTMADGREVEVNIDHNGDYSGDAILTIKTVSTSHSFEVRVPCEILVAFAHNAAIHEGIEALEDLLIAEP